MKKGIFLIIIYCFTAAFNTSNAQNCPTDLLTGQNLIINGDFSDDYANWSFTQDSDGDLSTGPDGYKQFTSGFSVPGYLFVAPGAQMPSFNNAFSATFNDHSDNADDKFLMVDGLCVTGVKIWKQDVEVKPNTNYYFSVWVNSLKDNPNAPGLLNFDVNNQNIGNITAPTLGGANPLSPGWVKFEYVWNSGSNPPSIVSISIEGRQTVGCGGDGGESDFALDDIAFIPGCSYGSAGPQPDLGPDKTLCGLGANGIELNAGVPINSTTTITWNDGTTGFGTNAPYAKRITTPGTYSVCVSDNGSCIKSDVIVISDKFSINLGPDRELCDPASITLDANFTGLGVTYRWFKDGVEAEGINTNKTYFVNTPGTYIVEVRDPICGLQTDEIIITTKAPKVTNKVYCDPGSITLNVTPSNDGKYKWWTSPTGLTPADLAQKGGDSYTFVATPTADYTFYVQDTASFRIPVGLPLTGNGLTGKTNRSSQNETVITFDILTAITIDSIYLDLVVYGCGSPVGVEIRNSAGTLVGSSTWTTTPTSGCATGSQILKMPVGLSLPVGTGYTIKYIEPNGNNTDMNWYDDGMSYPQTYSDVLKFVGPKIPEISGWKANSIPGMYRWVVTAGTACARVPVQAIYKSCVAPTPPIANAGSDIKLCNTNTTNLNASALATDETGIWTFATGSEGTIIPSTSPIATLTFINDTAYVVWTVTNKTSGLLDRDTVMVTTTNLSGLSINATDEVCPSTANLIFTAAPNNTSTGSNYLWSIISGDITFVSGANTYELTADAGFAESIVEVTVSKNGCVASTTHTLTITPLADVANAGLDQTICTTYATLSGNIPSNGIGLWTIITVDPNQILTQIPPNNATVSNLSTNMVYKYVYEITDLCGTRTTDTIRVTVDVGGFKITSITQQPDTLCIGSYRELRANVTGGSATNTYVWTKKGTTLTHEKTTPYYTVLTSEIEETYYLYVKNKGCVTDLDSAKIVSTNYQKLYVPNLITPNGDGLNDVFEISEVGNLNKLMLAKNSTLTIYNRWGNEVFRSDNYNNNWKATETSDGIYYYYLKAGCGGEVHKSWIQILGNTNK